MDADYLGTKPGNELSRLFMKFYSNIFIFNLRRY